MKNIYVALVVKKERNCNSFLKTYLNKKISKHVKNAFVFASRLFPIAKTEALCHTDRLFKADF